MARGLQLLGALAAVLAVLVIFVHPATAVAPAQAKQLSVLLFAVAISVFVSFRMPSYSFTGRPVRTEIALLTDRSERLSLFCSRLI